MPLITEKRNEQRRIKPSRLKPRNPLQLLLELKAAKASSDINSKKKTPVKGSSKPKTKGASKKKE